MSMLTTKKTRRRRLGRPAIQERLEYSGPNAGRHHWPKAAEGTFEALYPVSRQNEKGQAVESAAQVPGEAPRVP
eukprot:1011598-Pyramimonas_sp.AAC.1